MTTPKADISQFTIIDQDRKQVSREAREAIYIRRDNPVLSCNIGKMNIPKIFNQILGISYSTSTDVSTNPNDQNNNNPSSINRATRTINLHNELVYPPLYLLYLHPSLTPSPMIATYTSCLLTTLQSLPHTTATVINTPPS